jgi:DNA-binding MarR family transcriptional regulator
MPDGADSQPKDRDEVASLGAEVVALLAKVTERFDVAESNEEWNWIAQHARNPQVVEIMQDSTTTMMRVIDAIGRLEPVNGVTISANFRIPKGTVSKVTRRLITQELITTEYLPNNKKEILFRLTPLGRELFEVHRAFDDQMERGLNAFLRRYDADDLRLLLRVLEDVRTASFLDLGRESTND